MQLINTAAELMELCCVQLIIIAAELWNCVQLINVPAALMQLCCEQLIIIAATLVDCFVSS